MPKRLKNQKGMIFIAGLLTMLLFGALGMSMTYLTANTVNSSTEDLQSAQSFYVAEGGMQYVLMNQLTGDTNFSDNVSPTGAPFGGTPISLSPGQFWIEYLNQTNSNVTVRVTSRVGSAVRVIEQSAGQNGTGRQYVAMAGGNIIANSSTGNIYGDVGLKGNFNSSPNVIVHGNIYQDPSIVLPALDFNTYKNMCTTTYSGNLTISSNYTGNLCVTGNVTIQSNVAYTGLLYSYGNTSVTGNNVTINGSILAEGNFSADNRSQLKLLSDVSNPSQHMPAVASQGNLSIKNSDSAQVRGVLWNGGNIDLSNSDNLVYTGSFMAGGNVQINSATNMSITFSSDLLAGVPGLNGGGGTQSGSLSLSGWKTYAPWW